MPVAILAISIALLQQHASLANGTPQTLTFFQDWTNTSLIAVNDNWDGVPGIVGFLGDYTTAAPTGIDPQTLLDDFTTATIDVNANQTNPSTFATGGVAEFDTLLNPTIALNGSGTADAPFVLLNLSTMAASNINIAYNLRDLDGSADNAVQQVALHYRVGNTGSFTNLEEAYVADATTGPGLATLITPVLVELPPAVNNQPLVQIRIMTTNSVGNDEWVGIDDINVTGALVSTPLSAVGNAAPSTVIAGNPILLQVAVTPALNPTSTGIAVAADLSSIGGPANAPLFDDGVSGGDTIAGDNLFTTTAIVHGATTAGVKQIPVTVADAQQRSVDLNITFTVISPTSPSAVGSASPASVLPGEATLLTAIVTPGTSPISTGIHVTADLTAIGGAGNQTFFDDGTNGDTRANDNIFSLQFQLGAVSPGPKTLPLTIGDAEGRTGSSAIVLTVLEPAFVSISQVYGGGGNSQAAIKNDFIELLNRGTSAVNLTGWSVQYTSAAGSTWQVTPLTGTLPPGGYFLIQQAQGAGGTINLPAPDATGAIAMSATAGKVALVRSTTALSVACPVTAGVATQDFVGYGTANCFEGSGAVAALSNTLAAVRLANGCLDTNDNAADFTRSAPNPRNSSWPVNDCSVPPPPPPPPMFINQIQGNGTTSPFAGQVVRTTISIVTGVKSNGFFIQTPDGSDDADPATSEGIFVFTSSSPGAFASIGNAVEVTGTVVEFIPSADLNSPPVTEISGPVVTLFSTGHPLPSAVTLTAQDTSPFGSIEQLERFEGMRVHVDSLTAISGTQGSINETNATATSTGVFYAVVTGVPRPLREPGIEVPDPLPAGAPQNVPRFDANPERLRLDSDGQTGAANLNVDAGDVVTGVTGVLDYGFRTYTILPDASTPPAIIDHNHSATPVPMPTANQFMVGSANLQRLFDTLDDPGIGEPVLTQTALNNRLNKMSLYIRNVLRTPDILGVIEVENLSALTMLAGKVNNDAIAAGQPNPNYAACLIEGNDIGGIDSGFLVKSSRVTVIDCTQAGKTDTFIDPTDGSEDLLNDRPPLILRASIQSLSGNPFLLTVIANHLRSLTDVESSLRVRAKRRAQAEFLASLIQQRQVQNPGERIISVGDFNAFEFNDGFVDVIGTIKGTPTPADQVVMASPDLVNPDLINLVEQIPQAQRYSFSFDGNGQVLDHHLITQNLSGLFDKLVFARNNTDFAGVTQNDPQRSERVSDHDAPVSYFNFPQDTTTTVTSSLNPSSFGQPVTFTATVTTGNSPVTTGSVAFKDGNTPLGTVSLNVLGQASFTTSTLSSGPHVITAEFGGSGILGPSSGSVTQAVGVGTTTTVLTSSVNPSGYLSPVTFTATVMVISGKVTEGSVTFRDGATVLGSAIPLNASGMASFTTSQLSVGLHPITAEYSGSANFAPSMANLSPNANQVVHPSVSIDDVTVTEGNVPGTVAATFAVTLSAASAQNVSVDFATANVTALGGSDFVARTGTIFFAPGVTSQPIAIVINSDVFNEVDEIFAVNLDNAANAVIVDGQGIGTIANDDPLPRLSITDVTVREGNTGTTAAVFTVRLSAASGQTVMAHFATSDNTAVSALDYIANTGTLVFAPGALLQTITVRVNGDTFTEPTESFFVNLTNVTNADLTDGLGIATITNDDANPLISIGDVTVTEPDSGSTPAVFTVSLSNPSALTVSVGFATANASATAGSDYVASTGTLTFAPGVITQTISVPVLADRATEPVQMFFVNLSFPTNATIRDSHGMARISDAAAPEIISFSPLAGAAGTTVTITGSNFIGVTQVKFGSAHASFTVLSPTSIRATVPVTAETGPISVVSIRGAGTSALNFGVLPKITSFTPTSGAVGAVVTIMGNNFSDATAIKFNGTDATIVQKTSHLLRATVPAGATTGPITVITPAGTASTAGLPTPNFRVLPRITSFSPTSGTAGSLVTINGTNLAGGSVRFGTVTATVNSSNDTQIIATVPATAITGRITVTTVDGSAISATNFVVVPPS